MPACQAGRQGEGGGGGKHAKQKSFLLSCVSPSRGKLEDREEVR